MKEYIEKCLRRTVTIEKNLKLYKNLPLLYRGAYEFFSVYQDGIEWIIARPQNNLRLNALRYDQKQIEKVTGMNCAFYFTKLNYYTKEMLLTEGIPFVLEEKQMYLPFMGMLLADNNDRKLKPVHTISFLTQKLLLCALYEKWDKMNVTRISERLQVTKMSITRCLDELEYLDIDILDVSGKTRKVSVGEDIKKVWENIKPVLRNPVITKFQLAEDIGLENKAGISALCEYSLLSDNVYPTYAITKKELSAKNIKSYRQISAGETMGCEVLEVGYFIDFEGKNIQDPLSVTLSLSEKDLEDERVQICIDEMLEKYVW